MAQKNLQTFSEPEPLIVEEQTKLTIHGNVLGWAGPSNRGVGVLIDQLHRHKYEGGKQDYFRKWGGYSYDTITLDALQDRGVGRIAVFEIDNERFVEYKISQFRDSDLQQSGWGDKGGGDVKLCVPVEDAIHTWHEDEVEIIYKH